MSWCVCVRVCPFFQVWVGHLVLVLEDASGWAVLWWLCRSLGGRWRACPGVQQSWYPPVPLLPGGGGWPLGLWAMLKTRAVNSAPQSACFLCNYAFCRVCGCEMPHGRCGSCWGPSESACPATKLLVTPAVACRVAVFPDPGAARRIRALTPCSSKCFWRLLAPILVPQSPSVWDSPLFLRSLVFC